MDEREREALRMALQDAVYRAIEGGFTEDDIREEVDLALEDAANG